MDKRIFSLITVVAMLMSLFAISANATTYGNHNFNADNLDLNDLKIYKKSDIPPNAVFEVTQEDGTVHYYKEAGFRYNKNTHTPDMAALDDGAEWQITLPDVDYGNLKEFVLEYDYMIPDYDAMSDADYLYSDIFFAGVRQSWQLHRHRIKTGSGGWGRNLMFNTVYPASEGGHEGKWMTIAHHYYYDEASENPIPWKCDVYAKPRGAEEWMAVSENHSLQGNAQNRIRFFVYGDYKANVYFDNIRVYLGTELMTNAVVNEESVVTSVEEVTAGEITASGTVSTTEAKEGLRKIMVAYDKSGKMIDFKSGMQNLYLGPNEVSATIELDDAEAAAIADGGYVGLYLWDGMLPYINAVELK